MQPQTVRANLAVLLLVMGLFSLGGCRGWVSRPPVIPIAATFVGHVKADRYQEAYDMTSPTFRANITKKEFEEFCKRRNLPRERGEVLEPDRRKCPRPGGQVGIADNRILPFCIVIVKGEGGQWCVDEVVLAGVDDKLNVITAPEIKETEKE
jgi:hypothetical protein